MVYNSEGQVKKSLYIFLTCLMGALLFLTLHRLLVFWFFLFMMSGGYPVFMGNFSYMNFLAWEYITLILSLMLGGWYGVWVGQYWYQIVYEEKRHWGLRSFLAQRFWPNGTARYNVKSKIERISEQLEQDVAKMQNLSKSLPETLVTPQAIKRRVVRRRVAK
jgi:hypothetical protein